MSILKEILKICVSDICEYVCAKYKIQNNISAMTYPRFIFNSILFKLILIRTIYRMFKTDLALVETFQNVLKQEGWSFASR